MKINDDIKDHSIPHVILVFSSGSGNIELVEYFLKQKGIDINAKDDIYFNNFLFQNNIWKSFKLFWTALMNASSEGHTEIAKLLLEQEGIDINAKNDIYLNNFIFQNNIWKLFKLFETALIFASKKGHTEIVKLLNEKGAN